LSVDTADGADLDELTRRLEGMPLAIELAAPRLGIAGPGALLRQLDRGLDALGTGGRDLPARQRGLRAVLDWTCALLSEGERDLLGGLSAFGADVDPVLADEAFPGAFDAIATLLDVGLVTRTQAHRLVLRPPVRRYAAELVTAERRADQHRQVVRTLADLGRQFEARWLIEAGTGHRVLGPEEANILAALDWARAHDNDAHADLVATCGWWMTHQNLGRIGRVHADLALDRVSDPTLRARLLQARGAMALDESDPGPSLAAAEAWAALGDVEREVLSLVYGANLLTHARTDHARAAEISERALRLAQEERPDDQWMWWVAAAIHSQSLWFDGRRDEARALSAVVSATLETTADTDPWRRFLAATFAADFALGSGDARTALPLYTACIGHTGQLGSTGGQFLQACSVAETLLALGRAQGAARAVAACEHVDRELGHPMSTFIASYLSGLADKCDPALLKLARADFVGWSTEAAIDEVVRLARRTGDLPS
jgi:hypothetical protein